MNPESKRNNAKMEATEILLLRKILALRAVCDDIAKTFSQEFLAETFDISTRHVRTLKERKQWKDI